MILTSAGIPVPSMSSTHTDAGPSSGRIPASFWWSTLLTVKTGSLDLWCRLRKGVVTEGGGYGRCLDLEDRYILDSIYYINKNPPQNL